MPKQDPTATEKVYSFLTPQLLERLDQVKLSNSHKSRADAIRAAIRAYVDEQEDQIGSRRHFQKTMQRALDEMGMQTTYLSAIILFLLSSGLARTLTEISGETVNAGNVLQEAMQIAQAQYPRLIKQIKDTVTKLPKTY